MHSKICHLIKTRKSFLNCLCFTPRKTILKSKIEKTALSIILNIAKVTALEPDEKTKGIIDEQIQSINKISALFDIALDKNLIQKKDTLAIENQMRKLSENLLSLEKLLAK